MNRYRYITSFCLANVADAIEDVSRLGSDESVSYRSWNKKLLSPYSRQVLVSPAVELTAENNARSQPDDGGYSQSLRVSSVALKRFDDQESSSRVSYGLGRSSVAQAQAISQANALSYGRSGYKSADDSQVEGQSRDAQDDDDQSKSDNADSPDEEESLRSGYYYRPRPIATGYSTRPIVNNYPLSPAYRPSSSAALASAEAQALANAAGELSEIYYK